MWSSQKKIGKKIGKKFYLVFGTSPVQWCETAHVAINRGRHQCGVTILVPCQHLLHARHVPDLSRWHRTVSLNGTTCMYGYIYICIHEYARVHVHIHEIHIQVYTSICCALHAYRYCINMYIYMGICVCAHICINMMHVGRYPLWSSKLQCVAVCCSVLQCVAVCRSVLQCVAVCCSVQQCVAVCCGVLRCVACVAVYCSVLQPRV